MNSIVVGLNGTKSSFAAVDWVAERAARGATRVEIVMIAGTSFSPCNRVDAAITEAERRLRERAPDVQIAWRRFAGRMPASLFEHAQAADLIVVGCHRPHAGRSTGTARLPSRIASGSSVPVVVVPQDWSPAALPVVVGLDADGSSSAALEVAAHEAVASGTDLVIVHACPAPRGRDGGGGSIHHRGDHEMMLLHAARTVRRAHPALQVEEVLVEGDAADALLARGASASLIVLGTHHRGLFVGAILGSVGHDVLPRARVPLCIVPTNSATAATAVERERQPQPA